MSHAERLAPAPGTLITPTAEVWATMSLAQREDFLTEVNAALSAEALTMPESLRHSRAKTAATDMLEHHFGRIGKKILIATELAVHYPGETPCAPDLIAVLDVEDAGEDDPRSAWVVMDEGKGPDLVLEVLHAGVRRKDLIDNVLTYARLGIPEYFIFDQKLRRILGYRLDPKGAPRYVPIRSRGTRLWSAVLELELGLTEGRLRFFTGDAELPSREDVLRRGNQLLEQLEARAEQESAALERAQRAESNEREARLAAEAHAESEAQRAESEAQRAESEAQRAESEAQRAEALAGQVAALERELAELRRRLA